jgi:hypothetical protein
MVDMTDPGWQLMALMAFFVLGFVMGYAFRAVGERMSSGSGRRGG